MDALLDYIAGEMGLDPSEVNKEPVDSNPMELDGYKE